MNQSGAYQTPGIRRNGSGVTGFRPGLLPFGLEHRLDGNAEFSRENCSAETRAAGSPFRLFTVRLCPKARQRITLLLDVPQLHPEVRLIYTQLLAWATD